jgi:hypothetical protein
LGFEFCGHTDDEIFGSRREVCFEGKTLSVQLAAAEAIGLLTQPVAMRPVYILTDRVCGLHRARDRVCDKFHTILFREPTFRANHLRVRAPSQFCFTDRLGTIQWVMGRRILPEKFLAGSRLHLRGTGI